MVSFQNIKSILLDWDGTVIQTVPSWEQALIDSAIELGLTVNKEKRRQSLRWSHFYWANSDELIGDITNFNSINEEFRNNYIKRFLAILCNTSRENIEYLANKIYKHSSDKYSPNTFITPCLQESLLFAKKMGSKIGIISNQNLFTLTTFSANLKEYFDWTITASEVNSWKPDPKIFYIALKKLGMKQTQAVYIGDNYYADVIGARNAGIQPILFDPDNLWEGYDCDVIHSFKELIELIKCNK